MSLGLTLEKTKDQSEENYAFVEELIKQIRMVDIYNKYCHLSDESLLNKFIVSSEKYSKSSKNLNFDPLNQLLTHAFYNTIGKSIEKRTGHPTETFVHLRNKEFSSAIVSCSGVLVLYSLIWGYRSFEFLSIQELIESAENYICDAVNKASCYLDFVY